MVWSDCPVSFSVSLQQIVPALRPELHLDQLESSRRPSVPGHCEEKSINTIDVNVPTTTCGARFRSSSRSLKGRIRDSSRFEKFNVFDGNALANRNSAQSAWYLNYLKPLNEQALDSTGAFSPTA
jgi:hypothetical protein